MRIGGAKTVKSGAPPPLLLRLRPPPEMGAGAFLVAQMTSPAPSPSAVGAFSAPSRALPPGVDSADTAAPIPGRGVWGGRPLELDRDRGGAAVAFAGGAAIEAVFAFTLFEACRQKNRSEREMGAMLN